MRLTEFRSLVHAEFGAVRGDAIVAEHTVLTLSGRTPAAAIESGVDPRSVWRALCVEFDVPDDRQLGPDV